MRDYLQYSFKMRKVIYSGIALLTLCSTFSCKNKQDNSDEIIVEKIVEKAENNAKTTPAKKSSGTVKWVEGNTYSYSINITANDSLSQVKIGDETYKDNSAHLTISRNDGSSFFNGTFTKNSFTGLLSSGMKDHGALIGFSFDHADDSKLYFVASIGSPDESSEEFTLVQLIIDRMGATTVATYTPDEVPSE